MRSPTILAFVCLNAVFAQTAPPAALPDIPDTTVIATLDDGSPLTMEEFRKIYAILPEQNQQMFLRDRQEFLKQLSMMRKLARAAEKEKLDQESPTKEMLEYYRMNILSQAALGRALRDLKVPPAEADEYYENHKESYKEVKVKDIYISFSTDPKAQGKRTEEQAKTKAAKLLQELRAGADFVKLVKEYSDDAASKAKDGDFATIRASDNMPDAIRSAILSLKQGDVSEAIRQPSGFYIFRAESVGYRPLADVRDDILNMLKDQHWKDYLERTKRETKVEFKSPEFLGLAPASANPK